MSARSAASAGISDGPLPRRSARNRISAQPLRGRSSSCTATGALRVVSDCLDEPNGLLAAGGDLSPWRLVDAYRLRGWVYTDVRSTIEPSPDRSRARVRFSLTEREKVTVSGFVVKGAARTDPGLILRRLLLKVGGDFRQDLVRASEERIATLGTFASVSVALEDPEVPQRQKRVVITVVEQPSQYLEPRLGFSTGEGGRFAFEYGHRNIAGLAIALTLRIQLGYVFDFLLDPAVRQNYGLDRDRKSVV